MSEASQQSGRGGVRGRTLRRALRWGMVLVLAVVGLAISVPFLVDTSAMRSQILQVASASLGQEVMLDGEVRLTLFPRPTLSFDEVRIRNPRWSGDPELLSAERIVVKPVLAQLLRGQVSIGSMTLTGTQVWVERDPQGRHNWQAESAGGALPPLDDLRGSNVTVHFRASGQSTSAHVAKLNARIATDGRVTGRLDARIENLDAVLPGNTLDALGVEQGGVDLSTDVAIGPGATMELSDLEVIAPRLSATGDLRIDWQQDVPSVTAGIRIEELMLPGQCPASRGPGAEPSSRLVDVRPLDKSLAVPWTGTMSVEIARLRFDELDFADVRLIATSDKQRLSVRGTSGTDEVALELHRAQVGVSGARVEIRAGAERAPVALRCAGIPAPQANGIQSIGVDAQGSGSTWGEIVDGLEGRIHATGSSVEGAPEWIVTSIDAQLAEGRFESAELNVVHRGGYAAKIVGSGASLRGILDGEWAMQARWKDEGAELSVDALVSRADGGTTLRGSFIGSRQGDKAGGVLGLKGEGQWHYSGTSVSLSGLDITLGGNALKGDLSIDASTTPIAVTGHLKLKRTDLDWLASLAPEGAGDKAVIPDFVLDPLRVEVASLEGLPFPVKRVDTKLITRDSTLRFSALSLDLLAARWNGSISLDMSKKKPEAGFELTTPRLGLKAASAYAELLPRGGQAQGLKLVGRWTGADFGAVTSSMVLDASARRVSLGDLPARLGPTVLDDLKVRYRPAKGLSGSARASAREQSFTLELASTPRKAGAGWDIKASARGAAGELRAEGSGTDLSAALANGLAVSVTGEDVARAMAFMNVKAGDLSGPYRATARLHRDGESTSLIDLDATLERVGNVTGEVKLLTRPEKRPRVSARVVSQRLDLSGLLSPLEAPAGSKGRVIPNSPLPGVPELGVDVDLDLRAAEFIMPPHRFSDVHAGIKTRPGSLTIEPVLARLESGAQVSGRIDVKAGKPAPIWRLDLNGENVDLGVLVPGQPVDEPLGWPANARLKLEGPGSDLHSLLASARGNVHMIGKQTVRRTEDFSAFEGSIVSMMLPKLGDQRPSRLNCASIEAEFGDGKLTTEALVIDAETVTIAGSGAVDLRTEAVDMVLAPSAKNRSLLSGSTAVHVTGTLAKPKASVASGAVITSTGKLLVGVVNPYLLLGAFMPSPIEGGGDASACERALDEADAASPEVSKRAAKIQKSQSGGLVDILTAPFRLFSGGSKNEQKSGPSK